MFNLEMLYFKAKVKYIMVSHYLFSTEKQHAAPFITRSTLKHINVTIGHDVIPISDAPPQLIDIFSKANEHNFLQVALNNFDCVKGIWDTTGFTIFMFLQVPFVIVLAFS